MKLSLLTMPLLPALAPMAHAAPAIDSACSPIEPGVRELLSAYSRKDTAAVFKLMDPNSLLVLGTDVSEIADTREKARALLPQDILKHAGKSPYLFTGGRGC